MSSSRPSVAGNETPAFFIVLNALRIKRAGILFDVRRGQPGY
jgi:hypothetical protein